MRKCFFVGWTRLQPPGGPDPLSSEQAQLLLVLALGLARQLLDAVEGHLLGGDQRALRTHRSHQSFLNQVELADCLSRMPQRRDETHLALKCGPKLAQLRILADAADEP